MKYMKSIKFFCSVGVSPMCRLGILPMLFCFFFFIPATTAPRPSNQSTGKLINQSTSQPAYDSGSVLTCSPLACTLLAG